MIKHLRFVFMAVMAMMVGNAMADTDVTFTLNDATAIEALGITLPAAGQGTKIESIVKDGVTIAATSGTTDTRIYQGSGKNTGIYDFRVYKDGGSLTFSAGSNHVKKVAFTGANLDRLSADGYAAATDKKSGEWTGDEASVTLTATATATIYTIVVTYGASTDDRTATTIEFSGDYPTKFTCGKDGTSAALPTATVKAGDATVSGAAITWSIEKGSNWNTEVAVPTVSDNQITSIATSEAYGELVVKASFAGDATYKASSKSYKFMVYKGYMTIEEMVYDAGSGNAKWTAGVPVSFFNVDDVSGGTPVARQPILVTYVNGSYTYVNDGDSDFLLYGSSLGLKKGDKISGDLGNGQYGAIYGTLKCYNGLIELVTTKSEIEFKVVSSDNTVEAKTITVDKLADYMNAYVKIENAEYVSASNKNLTFKVGDADLSVYNQWNVKIDGDTGLVAGEKYTLEGMGSIYVKNDATTYQLYLIGFEKTADEAGVNAIKAEMEQGKVYNLQGQRVLNAQKGLYIVGGKKVVLK